MKPFKFLAVTKLIISSSDVMDKTNDPIQINIQEFNEEEDKVSDFYKQHIKTE